MANKKSKMQKAYEVEVTMTVRKRYTVVADSEEEAVEKLTESGIITPANENGRDEDYEEDYDVGDLVEVAEPDVE